MARTAGDLASTCTPTESVRFANASILRVNNGKRERNESNAEAVG